MCAWKRGTQNNMPGVIRKGHIKEFLQLSSKDSSITAKVMVLEAEKMANELKDRFLNCGCAFICTSDNGLPDSFLPFVVDNVLYLHAHEYPRSIVTAVLSTSVPYGSIILNEAHRVNSKVCAGEMQDWTVFQGEKFTYDCREGAIGDTGVRATGKMPPVLSKLVLEIKPNIHYGRNVAAGSDSVTVEVDCKRLASSFAKSLTSCIVTTEEIYTIEQDGVSFIGRVLEVHPEPVEGEEDGAVDNAESDFVLSDHYRGVVDEFTTLYLQPDAVLDASKYLLVDNAVMPAQAQVMDVVDIRTTDNEVFPVKRKLLRPCLALTAVVQAGKGKYKDDVFSGELSAMEVEEEAPALSAEVDVDACTFDRVLLYLEHEARGETFQFDPLLANELLDAAITLKIAGLQDVCNKVLGSFQERVRTTPIRLEEVLRRNLAGAAAATDTSAADTKGNSKKRSETLLLMSGMVFDITRWLDEHPGGSTIIPEQALNVDCTVFFEIYHASRQSFLYLKEFYIGELALEDRERVPLPREGLVYGGSTKASEAFMDQLSRITSWRLDVTTMPVCQNYKSF